MMVALVLGLMTFLALALPVGAQNSITIQLAAQNNSGQSGTAELTDMGNGMTRVVLNLANSPAGPQPVHIHQGTCANLNPQPLFPLTNLANGRSETMVNAPLATILAQPHAINAHKSPQEVSVYVACGNVVAAATTPSAPRAGAGGLTGLSMPLALAATAGLLTLVVGAATVARRRGQA